MTIPRALGKENGQFAQDYALARWAGLMASSMAALCRQAHGE